MSLLQFRRKRDGSILTLGTVSAISVFLGGIILVATEARRRVRPAADAPLPGSGPSVGPSVGGLP